MLAADIFLNRHWRTLDVPHGTRNYWKGTINYPFDLCTKNSWPFLDNSYPLISCYIEGYKYLPRVNHQE